MMQFIGGFTILTSPIALLVEGVITATFGAVAIAASGITLLALGIKFFIDTNT
jgi:hypothetical protein